MCVQSSVLSVAGVFLFVEVFREVHCLTVTSAGTVFVDVGATAELRCIYSTDKTSNIVVKWFKAVKFGNVQIWEARSSDKSNKVSADTPKWMTGSSASLRDLSSGHTISLKQAAHADSGLFRCDVEVVGQNGIVVESGSQSVTLRVQGKAYISTATLYCSD